MIDRATIDRIMDATNIVEVVSDFVTLRKSGTSYKGLCPFHDDRTPSFSVSPSRGVYKCFSCGKAGNAVNFIMEHEQMTYPEALKWLARKYHIEVRERELNDEEKQQESERESILIVNDWAAGYYEDLLWNDRDGQAIGMQYFRSRGFRDDIIRKFKLGFALSRRDATATAALQKGFQPEFLVKSGVCGQRDNGELYDRFAGRVIFPWMTVSGKVTAFGGRLLDSRTKGVSQKYVNSPDSPVYHKDHELYGIFQAKKSISKEDCVYMVEGYTDVISMHQCGIENVVANSGTALSVYQIRLLRRFTQNVVLLYDGDEAGIHAAMRGTDMMLSEGMNIKVLLLPDQEDPDSFARKHTAQQFKEYIQTHQTDFIEFKTQTLLRGVSDPIKRSEAISSIVKSISVIGNQIVRATYLKDCAVRIGIPEQTLVNEMNKFIRHDREERYKQAEREQQKSLQKPLKIEMPSANDQIAQIERLLVQEVVRHGMEIVFRNVENEEDGTHSDVCLAAFVYYDLSADGLRFTHPLYNRILDETVSHLSEEGFSPERYFLSHPDVEISQLASELSTDTYHLAKSNQLREEDDTLQSKIVHLLLDYRMAILKSQIKQLRQRISQAQSEEESRQLSEEWTQLMSLRMEVAKRVGHSIIV
ncbi:MAG: DNA primase [Prevotella sp.]|nr:DNA primase [Prevotella sp.]